MGLFIICTYSCFFKTFSFKDIIAVPETTSFSGTSGRIVFWIKIQDHLQKIQGSKVSVFVKIIDL